jgi:hypothetical protein
MLAEAAAIRLENKGPILLKQKRHGFNNELIDVFKIRLMHANRCDADAARLVSKGDRRGTRRAAYPQTFTRRIAPIIQRVNRPACACWATPACHPGEGCRHALRTGGRWLFRPALGSPGNYRLDASQRLARRNRHAQKLEQREKHDPDCTGHWPQMLDLKIPARAPFALFKSESAC